MDTIEQIREKFSVFRSGEEGIGSLFWGEHGDFVCQQVADIGVHNLSKVQLNQLLGFQNERSVSDGFFEFYWKDSKTSTYDLSKLPGYSSVYERHDKIQSLDQLFFGLYRIYVDGLLFRGNVRSFFREFSNKSKSEIEAFFASQRFDTDAIKRRGPPLPMQSIARDDRYLISEMACKSYGDSPQTQSDLKQALDEAWTAHEATGGKKALVRQLLGDGLSKTSFQPKQEMFQFSADEAMDEMIGSAEDIKRVYEKLSSSFSKARDAALQNTKLYLSLVNDLDIYVATSMRKRQDFRQMADRCEQIFKDERIVDLHLRYFDPTLSAAEGHQDKGLIECLMVKCAKVLVYCAGEKDSYGKDAEAAMALSLGKPVIFLCDESVKQSFYRDIHPLSRLIDFSTGVATGAIVTASASEAAELLDRIFENEMQYVLRQPPERPGYLQLHEVLTNSVVRLQTNNKMLTEAFWNYYKSQS